MATQWIMNKSNGFVLQYSPVYKYALGSTHIAISEKDAVAVMNGKKSWRSVNNEAKNPEDKLAEEHSEKTAQEKMGGHEQLNLTKEQKKEVTREANAVKEDNTGAVSYSFDSITPDTVNEECLNSVPDDLLCTFCMKCVGIDISQYHAQDPKELRATVKGFIQKVMRSREKRANAERFRLEQLEARRKRAEELSGHPVEIKHNA